MVKRLLLIALFAVTSLFAQNGVPSTELPKSRFVAQTEFYYSKLSIFRESLTFNGNGDFWLQFGREFRFAKYFSWTPSIGFNRNGWSFERAGHSGKMSFVVPYVSFSINAHPFDIGYVDLGLHYGRLTYCFGELDGKNTTKDDTYFSSYSHGFYTHIGADFLEHFRAGLVYRHTFIDSDDYPRVIVAALGGFVLYKF